MSDFTRRLFPEAIETEFRRLPWRLGGAALAAVSVAGYLSLLTWSNTDPSLNHATNHPAHNLLGFGGAIAADLLMQLAGLSAIVLLLPPLLWGFGIMRGLMPDRMPVRLGYWGAGTLLIASGLSAMPPTKSWPLDSGLGGVAGDLLAAFFIRLGGFIEPGLASAIGAALAVAAGIWALFRAMELPVADFAHAMTQRSWYAEPDPDPEPAGYPGKIIRRMTSLRARLLPAIIPVLSRALTRKPAGPREFWMKDGVFSNIMEAATAVKAKLEKAVTREEEEKYDGSRMEDEVSPEGIRLSGRVEPYFGPLPLGVSEDEVWEDEEQEIFDGSRSQEPYHMPRGYENRQDDDEDDPPAGPARTKRAPQTNDEFTLPSLKLLSEPPRKRADAELSDEVLRERAAQLESVLGDFGVKGRITRVFPGPIITLYELEPARGTKSSRVIGLADDIARSMSAVSARVAVVPGRDAIGIELPNETPETVHLRDLLAHDAFDQNPAKLALALGRTISGQPLIADLAKMPHLLIAGTTGSGKSVGINAMILSLLYRLTPSEARFIMIDPKMLELSVYDGIPHLLTPVVTDPKKAIAALKWTVNEMNIRYERMCKLGVRNISGYNQKVLHAQLRQRPLRRTVNTGFDELSGAAIYESEEIGAEPLPYIIVVIDEMADLMMVAGKEIEYCVMRLAQMARAAGIHLITATQRPSVDVITGTIKANFPSRISYQVTSKIDSRTILGEQGAEQLLGAGDMLYMAAGGRISRAHGPFVSESDVERVVRFLRSQGTPDYLEDVTEAEDEASERDGANGSAKSSGDALYDEAVAIVLAEKRATTSYLQRRLGIGYNRAATLIERMEENGIVSPPNRTGKREILVGAAN